MPAMRHLLTLSIVLSSVVVLVGLGLQDSPSPNPSPRLVNGDTTRAMQPERILPSVMPQLLQVERVFRGDDVTEVASAPAEADDRLTVQVLAFPFGDPVNAKLVAAYDSGDTPSFSGAGSWKPTRRTVHRWYLVDGQWLRNPTSFQRLDPPTR